MASTQIPHQKMTYVSTYLGNRFYPLEPRIDKLDIEDIAHGLAFQCRFNGQTCQFYSVAQHSLIVSSLVADELKFAALLHDAAEAYLGDMVKPLKILLPAFAQIEDQVTSLIAQEFKLDFGNYAPIKNADLIALATEKRDLMPYSVEDWDHLTDILPMQKIIAPMNPFEAKSAFLEEYKRLNGLQMAFLTP